MDLLAAISPHREAVRMQFTVDCHLRSRLLASTEPQFRKMFGDQILYVPCIGDRRDDLRPHILLKLGELNGRSGLRKQISSVALDGLVAYDFADNFRGLFRTLEWMHATQLAVLEFDSNVVECGGKISADSVQWPRHFPDGFQLNEFMRGGREKIIREALRQADHNLSRAARMLGVSPQAISNYVRCAARSSGREKS
jgi:transcriptional regulator with PAS, ATPase and Fis domain